MTILKTIDGNAIQSARQTISRRPFNGQKRKNFEQVSLHTWGILIFIAWIIVLPINGWAQHNRIVYVVSEREIIGVREIYTLVTDGTIFTVLPVNRKRLTNNDVLDLDPAWSPDGKKIAFASAMADGPGSAFDIFVMGADGKNRINLTQSPRLNERMPTWSPDGKRIAFVSGKGLVSGWEIYVMDARGKNLKRLTDNRVMDREPAWSPDGKWIAYASEADENRNRDIYVVSPDGRKRKKLMNQMPWAIQPSWSPDGKRITFVCNLDGNPDICVIKIDAVLNGNQKPINKKDVTNLTKHIAHDYSPTWSPTGDRIAFSSERQLGTMSIYVMDADGQNIVRLTDGPHSTQPDWAGSSQFSVSPRRLVTTWGRLKK